MDFLFWYFIMLSITLLQIKIKFCISDFMHYMLPTTKNVKKIESVLEFYIYHLRKYITNLKFIFSRSMLKNKNTNLHIKFYIIFIRNKNIKKLY